MMLADAYYQAIGQFFPTETGAHGTLRVLSGMALPKLNGVFSTATTPDTAEIARLADGMPGGLPWSVQVRGEPGPEVVEIAAAHGLTGRISAPMMLFPAAGFRPRGSGTATVRRIGVPDLEAYADVLTSGFGAPRELLAGMITAEALELPKVTTYLVEDGDGPVATGIGALAGDVVTIFNIATIRSRRGRGYGRLVTETVMRDAFEAGATRAFLQSSDAGLPLYTAMGFTLAETWTYLTA
ncbi:GNAT family N-acetyltransferase [Catenuloplanes japonicus]|uniref:GNAT family N-acetyltransferase n=1 Tax=Catenuloplanes japonicus TaxID=33876 RepID=UPI000A1024B7|nr:GNAT family N-acetyltransferase [Catenuloplanes japonicus]